MAHWLFKSEPETYSFDQLIKDKSTNWNNVRNYQARNFLRECKKGDIALIYHSGDDKAVVGVAKVVKEAYPDIDPEGGDWVQIDIAPVKAFKTPVTLAAIKAEKSLDGILLVKQSRLSCMPITDKHFKILLKMGGVTL